MTSLAESSRNLQGLNIGIKINNTWQNHNIFYVVICIVFVMMRAFILGIYVCCNLVSYFNLEKTPLFFNYENCLTKSKILM